MESANQGAVAYQGNSVKNIFDEIFFSKVDNSIPEHARTVASTCLPLTGRIVVFGSFREVCL